MPKQLWIIDELNFLLQFIVGVSGNEHQNSCEERQKNEEYGTGTPIGVIVNIEVDSSRNIGADIKGHEEHSGKEEFYQKPKMSHFRIPSWWQQILKLVETGVWKNKKT